MLSVTDTTFDLLVLQLLLHAPNFGFLLLSILSPVCARSEYDVLSHPAASQYNVPPRRWNTDEVVSAAGPAPSLAERPNLLQFFRSATRGLTTSLCVVNRIRRVVLTFFPSSLKRHVTIVLVPSLFVVVVCAGRASTVSSSSSSSAQSWRLINVRECKELWRGRRGFSLCDFGHLEAGSVFDFRLVYFFAQKSRRIFVSRAKVSCPRVCLCGVSLMAKMLAPKYNFKKCALASSAVSRDHGCWLQPSSSHLIFCLSRLSPAAQGFQGQPGRFSTHICQLMHMRHILLHLVLLLHCLSALASPLLAGSDRICSPSLCDYSLNLFVIVLSIEDST